MKAKTDVKAGRRIVVANVALNASSIHQWGFGNVAYVGQTAIAGNFI